MYIIICIILYTVLVFYCVVFGDVGIWSPTDFGNIVAYSSLWKELH